MTSVAAVDAVAGATGARRRWWTSFAALLLMVGVWSLAMPPYAGPDEAAHVLRAAAVARGQLLVKPPAGQAVGLVRAPRSLPPASRPCFAFRPSASAACQRPLPRDDRLHPVATPAARYPPLYYLLVGLVGRLVHGPAEARLERFASASLCAALLASAVTSLRCWRGRLAPAGLAFAVTPMVLFLGGVVNPNGFEVSAAVCLWVSLLPLLRDPAAADRRLVARTAVAAGALVLSRPLSPLWLLLVLGVAGGVSPHVLRAAVSTPRVRTAALLTGAAGVGAVLWIWRAGSLTVVGRADPHEGFLVSLPGALHGVDSQIHQMIGNFGWLDTPAAAWPTYVWLLGVGCLLLPALTARPRRLAAGTVLLVVGVVVLPVVLEARQAHLVGLVWQGRYTLPLAAGIPVLAAWTSEGHGRADPRSPVLLVVLSLTGQVWALVRATARYTVGTGRGLGLLHPQWAPPLPSPVLLLLFTAAASVLGRQLLRPGVDPGRAAA